MPEQPPMCERCGKPMTPYQYDPQRWWVCTVHLAPKPREIRSYAAQADQEGR